MKKIINDFIDFTDDKKTAFFLTLTMKTVSLINNNVQRNIAEKAIEYCWKWLDGKSHNGDFLYELLVDEENGITIFAENTENISELSAWNCIIDAIAFTSRKAYEYKNTKYYPEPIELVSDQLIHHFMECYNLCFLDDIYADKISDYIISSGNKSEWKNYSEKII
ncbi:MAG: Imm6 family immunity protein [Ruminococcus flavefaciens]|nr:Imm6 family immunity protein [Ruminococcus flavefaciens]